MAPVTSYPQVGTGQFRLIIVTIIIIIIISPYCS